MSGLRTRWSESPELREHVRAELDNWGRWARDHDDGLGYPRHQPWYRRPRDARDRALPPPHDESSAEATENNFRLWRILAREDRELIEILHVLRAHYLRVTTASRCARLLGVSRRTYYRLLDEGMYRYWVISSDA